MAMLRLKVPSLPEYQINLMEELLNLVYPKFDFEDFLKRDLGILLDSKRSDEANSICKFYLKGSCSKGSQCPYKHTRFEKSVVCKHWLRGLCKKGDNCEFLHEYNMKKMPECWFFSKYGECCNGDECIYLHIDPGSKVKECAWYDRGFCKHGPSCRHKHLRKMACPLYVTGFCPRGPECPHGHPKYELPQFPAVRKDEVDAIQPFHGQSQPQHQQQQQHLPPQHQQQVYPPPHYQQQQQHQPSDQLHERVVVLGPGNPSNIGYRQLQQSKQQSPEERKA